MAVQQQVNPQRPFKSWLAGLFFLLLLSGLTWLAYTLNNRDPEWREPRVDKKWSTLNQDAHTEDLEVLASRGQLRVLTQHINNIYLPRQGYPPNLERRLVIKFAEQLGLQTEFIHVEHFTDLLLHLNLGHGDLALANLTVTDNRKKQVAFTVPMSHSREQIICRAEDEIHGLEDLSGRTLYVPGGTSFWETAQQIQAQVPDLQLKILPSNLTVDQNLDRLISGDIDLLIGDSNILDIIKTYRDDIKTPLVVSEEKYQAWAVRKQNPQLLQAVNRFLTEEQITQRQKTKYFADLGDIKANKTLRLLTRNNAASYFLWRGELMGFEYEIVKHFAKQQGLHLEIIVAATHEELVRLLLEGKGDLIAAFLTPTEERRKQGLAFSRPYHFATETIVTRIDDNIQNRADLHDRTLVARPTSAYWQTLERLQNELAQEGINVHLQAAPEDMETEEIMGRVASGEYDLTVADSHLIDIELSWRNDIKAAFPLTEAKPQAWAVRSEAKELLKAINKFHKKEYRGLVYNVIYNRYFKDPHNIQNYQAKRSSNNGQISPYDELIKTYAEKFVFDWRLLVAQTYQESQFNPNAKSWAGALGLMQIMPRTGKQFGLETPEEELIDVNKNIHIGVQYMDWVRARFEDSIPVKDRLWFTLAGYNAGWGHVQDARRLANELGLNPNRWFNHVEKAMLLLSKKKYAAKARHGYVRGQEPVNYVRNIRERYHAYLLMDEEEQEGDDNIPNKQARLHLE